MDTRSSIAKVSIEYHDPSGVFPLLAPQLNSRLPLRDLHWKSSTRPLRSINTLHLDLVDAQDAERLSSKQTAAVSGQTISSVPTSERRHQIPGLRQTPYLKVYLLRCDDNDTYKTTARKTLREWLKAHTPASQSSSSRSSQEYHDAHEWLIVHVVLPNTVAATQPRASGASSKTENSTNEKVGNSSKLLGRSSGTILEKLRADFNVSSKQSLDRVEQIRLRIEDLPSSIVPSLVGPVQDQESKQDYEDSWQDLLSTIKNLILSSFTLRVSRYEDDIRERDAQRLLPGWNFCTFFMLKEGLLLGFESVGLLDDALGGYDELSLGLEATARQADGLNASANTILEYTKDMKDILLRSLTSQEGADVIWHADDRVISESRKDYRNLIVNSNVSRFDFECYVFARQASILIRMANSGSSSQLANAQAANPDIANLSALSDLAQRTVSFIAAVSRTLKTELKQVATAQGVSAPEVLIDNIVSSFGYAVTEQILSVTNVPILDQELTKPASYQQHTTLSRLQHPERRDSLPPKNSFSSNVDDPLFLLKYLDLRSLQHQQPDDEFKTALADQVEVLAGFRADLILLQRRILERAGLRQQWAADVLRLHHAHVRQQQSPKADSNHGEKGNKSAISGTIQGVVFSILFESLASFGTFNASYEKLTILAMAQCSLATRSRMVSQLGADLALLKHDHGDFNAALNLLTKVLAKMSDQDWDDMELRLLRVHLSCLKAADQMHAYVSAALTILSRAIEKNRSLYTYHRGSLELRSKQDEMYSCLLQDVLETSRDLSQDIYTPLLDFFGDISAGRYVRHFADEDGFQLVFDCHSALPAPIIADEIKLQLASRTQPMRELWLRSTSTIELKPGINSCELSVLASCSGIFAIEKILISAGKIVFDANVLGPTAGPILDQSSMSTDVRSLFGQLPDVHSYVPAESLNVLVSAARVTHINKPRLLEVVISSGRNMIQQGRLSLRAGSAGLRLMTVDATVVEDMVKLTRSKQPGSLGLQAIASDSSVRILLPYKLETNLPRITISIDLEYTTPTGSYHYFSNPSVDVGLALDVNVFDTFKEGSLLSRFQLKAAPQMPVVVTHANLSSSDQFAVQASPLTLAPIIILPQQDATLLYNIQARNKPQRFSKTEGKLELVIDYSPLSNIIFDTLEHSLLADLPKTPFGHLRYFLSQLLDEWVQALTYQALEEMLIMNECNLPAYDAMGWHAKLERLEPVLRAGLDTWIRRWHAQNRAIALQWQRPGNMDAWDDRKRSIVIDVPVPRLLVLHTATLFLPRTDCIVQGNVMTAEVRIHHTRAWDSNRDDVPDELNFGLEVDAPLDTWLLAGNRRATFSAREGEIKTFQILLMPLRTGGLRLPEVNVRWHGAEIDGVRNETDFRSASRVIVVVSNTDGTSVGLHEVGTGTDVMLMSSGRA